MIRKPDASVFEDSTTVKVVRTTREVAVEGGATAAQTVSRLWFAMILVVFIFSGLGAMVSAADSPRALLVVPFIGGAVWLLIRLLKPPTRKDAFDAEPEWVAAVAPRAPSEPTIGVVRVKYWVKGVVNKATLMGLAGVALLFADGTAFSWWTVLGVILVARTVLVLSPLFGSRDCIVAERETITVHTLLGSATLPTSDLAAVDLKTFRWRSSWWVGFSTGSRQHLVIVGLSTAGRRELLVPYTLLGLDQDGARQLGAKLLTLRDQARGAVRPVSASSPRPAAPERASQEAPLEGFDPDAIMARYLAERAQLQRRSGMPPVAGQQPAARGFGRKGVARVS